MSTIKVTREQETKLPLSLQARMLRGVKSILKMFIPLSLLLEFLVGGDITSLGARAMHGFGAMCLLRSSRCVVRVLST
jgi:hypothetical protein